MALLMREEEIREEASKEGIKGTVTVLKDLEISVQALLIKIQGQERAYTDSSLCNSSISAMQCERHWQGHDSRRAALGMCILP